MRRETARKLIADRHTLSSVLAHWPRQMIDALLVSVAFLALLTLRTFIAFPQCGVPLKDIDYFQPPDRNKCKHEVWLQAALENSLVAYVSALTAPKVIFEHPRPNYKRSSTSLIWIGLFVSIDRSVSQAAGTPFESNLDEFVVIWITSDGDLCRHHIERHACR